MTAATRDRRHARGHAQSGFPVPVASGARIYESTIVVRNADGFCQPKVAGDGFAPIGIARTSANNNDPSGAPRADGYMDVSVQMGQLECLELSAPGSLTLAAAGSRDVYALDDQTIGGRAESDGLGNGPESRLGRFEGFDDGTGKPKVLVGEFTNIDAA